MDPTALLTATISFIEAALPNLVSAGTAGTITRVIAILQEAIPLAIQVEQDVQAPIQNIIAALKAGGAVTADQLDALDKQEAALDAAFDAAVDAATAADAPASGAAT